MVTFVVQFGYSWGLIPTVLMTLLEAIVDTIFWVSFFAAFSLQPIGLACIYRCVGMYVFSRGLVGQLVFYYFGLSTYVYMAYCYSCHNLTVQA